MNMPITDIVALEENPANREKFFLLEESAGHWGVSGILFQSSDNLVARYVRQNSRDMIVLIGGDRKSVV